MPEMNGFEFLDAYESLPEVIKKKCIIVMLTSSAHAEDQKRVSKNSYVKGYLSKPLSQAKIQLL
jgi:CheY-like chemotaxis protein